jgi:transcriptional regulator GlxA family with amidase domain
VESTSGPRAIFPSVIRSFSEFRRAARVSYGDAMSMSTVRVPHSEIVARVDSFLRDNLSEPVTMSHLSRVAGVSERTLRAAFHHIVGISPKQHIIRQRLQAARDALLAAVPGSATVTDIAMSYGFFELGRFAGRYRQSFGEVPSWTLRHDIEQKIA